jgi:hypothetical protein
MSWLHCFKLHEEDWHCSAAVKPDAAYHWGDTSAAQTPDRILLVRVTAPSILQGCMLTAPSAHAM